MLKIKSVFLKNVLSLFKGNVVFQFTIILTLIFLARHYSPTEIGQYSVFVSVISIFSTIAPGRLEMAIMLPKDNKEAFRVYQTSFYLIVITALVFLVVSLTLYFLDIYFVESKIYFIPLIFFGIILSALNLLQIQYLNRLGLFNTVSNGKIIIALVISFMQVSSVYLYKNVNLLALSYVIAFFICSIYYTQLLNKKIIRHFVTISEIKEILKKYKKFPTLNNLSSLFNIVANQGPVIALEIVFGGAISGFYAVVQKTLNAPASLIGAAFSQVFYKKVSKESSGKDLKVFMLQSLKYLGMISVLIFMVIMLFSDFLYVFVFGEEYIVSAKIARIMVLFFLVRLMFSSMSTLIIAKNKLSLDLKFNIVYAVSLIFPVLVGWVYQLNWVTVINVLAINGALCFLFLGFLLFKKI